MANKQTGKKALKLNRKRKNAKNQKRLLASVVNKNQFEVVVLATMSAGKSTIINALIGTELLPSSNQACTARVFKIEDYDGMDGFKAAVISHQNEPAAHWTKACPESLKQLNDSDETGIIIIQGDIKSVFNHDLSLAIYDTPGPNNSQDERHGQITKDILSDGNFGLVLYALNATQIGVEDDAKLLHDLYDLIGNDLEHKKVVFVVNKADQLDEDLGERLDDVVSRVEAYLERHGFKSPTVLPLSSVAALLGRKTLRGELLTGKEKRTFKELVGHVEDVAQPLYEHSNLPIKIKAELKSNNSLNCDAERLIEYSGITAIEHLLHQRLKSVKKEMAVKPASSVQPCEVTVLGTMSAGKSTANKVKELLAF